MCDGDIKTKITRSWDSSSGMYDSCPGHQIGSPTEEEAWMTELRYGIPAPPLQILDVGCGTGAMGLLFAKMGYEVSGIDLSDAMMNQAKSKATAQNLMLKLYKGDAEDLPFPDESFDVIVNRHLLWTLPNPQQALTAWYRVLKPGGTLLIIDGVWNDKRWSSLVRRRVSEGLTRIIESDKEHHHGYDKDLRDALPHDGGVPQEMMIRYLNQSGFSNPSFRDLMYIRRLQRERMPWYRKITVGKSYYILQATKQAFEEMK